jgi:hypothetical protein
VKTVYRIIESIADFIGTAFDDIGAWAWHRYGGDSPSPELLDILNDVRARDGLPALGSIGSTEEDENGLTVLGVLDADEPMSDIFCKDAPEIQAEDRTHELAVSVVERIKVLWGDPDLNVDENVSFAYSWNHGYEKLDVEFDGGGGYHFAGAFHPGDGCCDTGGHRPGNCRFCGCGWL